MRARASDRGAEGEWRLVDEALVLRPVDDRDLPFLRRVYGSTRADELARVPWSDTDKERFLDFQFEAQHRYYREHFPNADYDLIVLGEEPVGRLYVDRRDDEIRLIDIALLPQYRGQGIGGRLLEVLLAEARQRGLPVRIHVERGNMALGLYQRLGFREIEEQGVYYLMEWNASA